MIYTADITTANWVAGPAPTVLETKIKVTKGLVYRVEIEFPPGAAGLHHVVVYDRTYQIWPSSPGITFHGGWSLVGFDDTYLKLSAPFEFNVMTWNFDTAYSHLVQVRIGMVSNEVFMARYLPTYAYEHFLKLLKAEEKSQKERLETMPEVPFPWLSEPEEE